MGAKSDVSNRTRSEKGKLASRRNFACFGITPEALFPLVLYSILVNRWLSLHP